MLFYNLSLMLRNVVMGKGEEIHGPPDEPRVFIFI